MFVGDFHEDPGLRSERLALIFEQSPMAIQVFNATGECIEVNGAWQRLWEATIVDAKGYNILHDPQVASRGILTHLQQAFAGHAVTLPLFFYDPVASGKRGRPRWMRSLLYPVITPTRKVAEVVLIMEDVTEAKNAQEDLERKNAELERTLALTVRRELKMVELKAEIEALKAKLEQCHC